MFRAALLSSMMLPWLLPKMHERFFFLADIIAFALAWLCSDRKSGLIFLGVQGASVLAMLSYATGTKTFAMAGALLTTIVIAVLAREMVYRRA